ncbi:hypothetical protein PENTCL1PPCAC_1716 [Pristionchus entomophagus]|uniref:C3H1-type domain-containing protein n=1 Tax=Pristionchus entomophagus TaxID=358040 RepID=A0AAV5S8W8_9BILA|nr:hypothetical protein PENTCL1PPCAC_1716 [Pristionchus entomophagus]
MSLNLLAGYGSDEDSAEEKDQDEYGEDVEEKEDAEDETPSTSDETKKEQDEAKQKSFFSSDFASSSEDDEDEEEDESTAGAQLTARLPSARSVLMGTAKLESSLFISEAEKEQDANNAMLSQHVPVSEKVKAEQREFRGKRKGQPCRQFMAGKCNRGVRCRFSHVLPEENSGPNPLSATIESKAAFYTDANEVFNKKAKLN